MSVRDRVARPDALDQPGAYASELHGELSYAGKARFGDRQLL